MPSVKLFNLLSRFFFDTAGAKKIAKGSQARRKSPCEFAKKKRRGEIFALCGARGGLRALHLASF
jgi:hypothetical protein